MPRIVFLSRNNEGHLFQALSLAQELRARGHSVTLVSEPEKADKIAEKFGIDFRPVSSQMVEATWFVSLLPWFGTLVGARADFVRLKMFQILARALLQRGPALLAELKPDIVVVDQNVVAGSTLCDHLGVPFVTLATSVPWHAEPQVVPHFCGWRYTNSKWGTLKNRFFNQAFEVYMQPVLSVINAYRRQWRMPPLKHTSDTFSKLAQLSQLCPTLDLPRSQLPKVFQYVGSLGAKRKTATIPFPWEKLDGRPLIFASMGTVRSRRNVEVFRKISEACASLPVQLVMSLGRFQDDTTETIRSFGVLPNRQILVGFAPQTELLDRAALLITHAGVNTVLEAVAREVPMIALPRNVDHPAMATRIDYAGIGLRASLRKFTSSQMRSMIEQVLSDGQFKARVKTVRDDLDRCGGVAKAADVIEAHLPSA